MMFESEKKEKSSELDETIAFGAVLLVVIALILFSLPIAVLSVVFCMLGRLFVPKKIRTIISVVSLIFSGVCLKLFGWTIFIQHLAFYRNISFLKNTVIFLQEKVQNGRPFVFDWRALLVVVFSSLFVSMIIDLIISKLKKNWFTHEKENDAEEYENSEKFKKIDKNKEKYLNQIQEKYRKEEKTEKICLGMDTKKTPVMFDLANMSKHCTVAGTTGSGKTVAMYSIMEGYLRKNLGVVFVDGKGDPKTIKEIESIAKHYGKNVFVFSDRSDWHYNPVKYGKPTSITDRLIHVMEWSEQYYKNASSNTLQGVISFLKDFGFKQDLETIYDYLDIPKIGEYLYSQQKLGNEEKGDKTVKTKKSATASDRVKKYNKLFFKKEIIDRKDIENMKDNKANNDKVINGLRTQLEQLIYSDLGEKFKEVEGKTIDIKETIENGDIVVFSLNSNEYDCFIGVIGRFIIADCTYVVQTMYDSAEEFEGALGIFDEFGAYGNDKIVKILARARSANFGAIIGIQSLADLENEDNNIHIKQQVIDNCNLFILGRAHSVDSAEEIAGMIGTYKDIDRMVMTENQGGKLMRFETKGERGTVRKVNKYIISPDKIKDMETFTFFYMNKNQKEGGKRLIYSRPHRRREGKNPFKELFLSFFRYFIPLRVFHKLKQFHKRSFMELFIFYRI